MVEAQGTRGPATDSQSANMCCQTTKPALALSLAPNPRLRLKPKAKGKKGLKEGGPGSWEVGPMDAIALPRDAKVHQALKCRKLKQAFNEMKAPREMRCAAGWTAGRPGRWSGSCSAEWLSILLSDRRPGLEDGGKREQVSPARNEHKESIN